MGSHTPVLIKSALALVTEMLCEDGFEGTQATDGLNISHDTHHNNRRSLNDGDRLYLLSFGLLCGRNMEDIYALRCFYLPVCSGAQSNI